jgi:NADH-quinone oxidoreductase subunit F
MNPLLNHEAAKTKYGSLREAADEKYASLLGEERNVILLGAATCGIAAGANDVAQAFTDQLSAKGLDADIQLVGCMGHCYAEPMAIVKRPGYPPFVYSHLNPGKVRVLVQSYFVDEDPLVESFMAATGPNEFEFPTLADFPRYGFEHRRLLKRGGLHDPRNIDQAIALGAYEGLVKALAMTPAEIIDTVKASGLRGMGGAGFPVWRKWLACSEQPEPRYMICNADEGDPGAFMDRTLLESDPHAVIEGMIVGALAVGSSQGYVYVRAEYPLAVKQLLAATEAARKIGLLGEDILGSGFSFDIEIITGAGAFVCGESSALMYSIEGKRGWPRVRPPQSVESGLFGKPTVLNNVKSYASIGPVLTEGPEGFASIGTEKSKGTAVFALAGKIENPGLVEVPMGTTLRSLIFDIGGGVPGGKAFKAVQIGGPSGGCLPESMLDTPVDFDALAQAGSMMGSGGMVILDEDNCMVETARFFTEFMQRESCGKCTFCRIGTKQMLDLLAKIVAGEASMDDLESLERLAGEVQDGSLCNLGKTAPNPVLTTLRFFRNEYEAHINNKECPAKMCKALTAYYILPDKCARGCDACVGSCPPEVIWTNSKRIKIIEQNGCVGCDSCRDACPDEYSAVVKISPISAVPPSEPRPEKKETS